MVTGRETIAVAVVVVATAATGVEAATIDIMGKFGSIFNISFINDYGFHNLIYMHDGLSGRVVEARLEICHVPRGVFSLLIILPRRRSFSVFFISTDYKEKHHNPETP